MFLTWFFLKTATISMTYVFIAMHRTGIFLHGLQCYLHAHICMVLKTLRNRPTSLDFTLMDRVAPSPIG